MRSRRTRGFTLIELLVVIAIVALLAGIILAGLAKARNTARQARVNAEISQITKAAEKVYADYGYYPSDSDPTNSGNITCPQDIVIATGKTFGSYIAACNDPWGHPYHWDNVCGNGAKRGSATCPAYSDSDPGPIGVTVVGSNGAGDGCVDGTDDTCAGSRGHLVYQGIITAGGGPSCLTSTNISCSDLSVDACFARHYCLLDVNACSGTFQTQNQCSDLSVAACTPSGCSINASGNCSGTPSACSTYTASGSGACAAVSGCTWNGTCGGTQPVCSTKVASGTCTAALCTWNVSSCTGTSAYNCAQFNGTNSATCQGTAPQSTFCTWQSTGALCNRKACSTFNSNATNCNGAGGCVFNVANCSAPQQACSTRTTQPACTAAGCSTWTPGCQGTPSVACTTYTDSPTCGANGCGWTDTSTCHGTYSVSNECSQFNSDQTSCESNSCSWHSGTGLCTGTPQSCSNLDQNTCSTQAGCSWSQ